MTPLELRVLCEIMKEFDIVTLTVNGNSIVRQIPARSAALPEVSQEETVDIKHKIEEVKSVMQLGDEELLNRMFPEETEETGS